MEIKSSKFCSSHHGTRHNQQKKNRKGIALESLNGTSTRGVVEGLCGRVGSEDPCVLLQFDIKTEGRKEKGSRLKEEIK
jgi:hypothetical protein